MDYRITEVNFFKQRNKWIDDVNRYQAIYDHWEGEAEGVAEPDEKLEKLLLAFDSTLSIYTAHVESIQYDAELQEIPYKDEEFVDIYRKNTRQDMRRLEKYIKTDHPNFRRFEG